MFIYLNFYLHAYTNTYVLNEKFIYIYEVYNKIYKKPRTQTYPHKHAFIFTQTKIYIHTNKNKHLYSHPHK